MNRYRIRRIEAGDSLDELTSMLHRAFGVLGRSGLNCPGVDQSIEATFHRARRGDRFVAIADGRIVGTLTLESPDRGSACHWYRRPDVASLHQFAVDPCHQGLGCGKALLEAAEQWAREHGHPELALDTPSDASHLVAFYRTQGLRVVGEMHRPGRHYRSAILSKTLSLAARETMSWRSPHRTPWLGTLVRT